LSTVYSIVRNHGATIDVNSAPGKGTEFSITFPAIAETAPEPEIGPEQSLPRGSGERILIVDDEPAILRIAQDALFAYGYIADTAHDGEEASRMVSAHPPGTYALVVTDSQMPRMSGLDSAILMRRHDPALHIVICSGSSVSASPELSPVAYLAKPFNEEELVTLIHRLLHPA
ncbi:MAG TPA: response regulator, partial [Thermoanaerobaculia bacterium]